MAVLFIRLLRLQSGVLLLQLGVAFFGLLLLLGDFVQLFEESLLSSLLLLLELFLLVLQNSLQFIDFIIFILDNLLLLLFFFEGDLQLLVLHL